jgi:hypothetical protein
MSVCCPLGLEYTTESPEAVLEFHKAVTALAGYSSDPTPHLDKALEFDPKFVLPHVFKGCCSLTGGGLPSDEAGVLIHEMDKIY